MRSEASSLVVAVDIGGTFTDITLHDPATGDLWRSKTPSTPSDPSVAFLRGVHLVLEQANRRPEHIGRVLHGTTVATNMILERKGARTALVTTAGFRHVLAIGRQDIPRRANLYSWVKPARPVPSSRVFEVRERMGPGGRVLQPLDEASVEAVAAACRKQEVEAIAVCLLHSFANPAHELRVAELLHSALPDAAITTSYSILPVVREYERSLATVLNASVMPGVSTYVRRLEDRLGEAGLAAPLLLMQSNGGVAGASKIRSAPALTALSGPAAGVVGARAAAAACGIHNLLTVDIGGTSADICLIKDGQIGLTQHGVVGDWPLPLPMVDMVTIGAGGGSIARVSNGALTVGPRSAGAEPGPACYGRGGGEATVTDAHVVLGHLPHRLLGGRMALDDALARDAIAKHVGGPLGLPVEAAARGVLAIADSHMVGALRVVSVERGHDPRDFTLVPFGGAGPLHGCALARLLDIQQVMIPPAPGILCADGLLGADLRAEFSRTLPEAGAIDVEAVLTLYDELEHLANDWLAAEEIPQAERILSRVALMRYRGQGAEIPIPWRGSKQDAEEAFAGAHAALYGFTLESPIELVTVRVEATGSVRQPRPPTLPAGHGVEPVEIRSAIFDDARETLILDRNALRAGDRFAGPALVSQLDATTLVPPGWECEVHPSGALLLTLGRN